MRSLLLLILLLLAPAARAQTGPSSPAGRWRYAVDTGGPVVAGTFALVDSSGVVRGSFSASDGTLVPVGDLRLSADTLSGRVLDPVHGAFQLRVHFRGDAFSGEVYSDVLGAFPIEGERRPVFTLDTPLRAFHARDDARALLDRHLPGIWQHPQIDEAMDLSLRQVQAYVPDEIPDALLRAIEADLSRF